MNQNYYPQLQLSELSLVRFQKHTDQQPTPYQNGKLSVLPKQRQVRTAVESISRLWFFIRNARGLLTWSARSFHSIIVQQQNRRKRSETTEPFVGQLLLSWILNAAARLVSVVRVRNLGLTKSIT